MISSFSEERFPVDVAFGSTGGPERQTDIVTLGSGIEERNQRWHRSRRRFEAGYGVRTFDELQSVLAFFEARRGQLQAFRFRDPLDWKSCASGMDPDAGDQELGLGNGQGTTFMLCKHYGSAPEGYARPIHKPVRDTVLIAVDGAEVTAFSVDLSTGTVVLASAPSDGAVVTAGFEFDVPVRFDTDRLSINLAAFDAGEIPSVPLLEVLL